MNRDDLDRLRLDRDQRRPSGRGSTRLLAAATLVFASGALVYRQSLVPPSIRESAAQQESRDVETSARTAVPSESASLIAGGFLEARREATVYPGREGIVAAVHVEVGQHVSKGELLLELNPATALAELATAEAEHRGKLARHALLLAGSREELLQRARARREAAEAEWRQAQAQLERVRPLVESRAQSTAALERAVRDSLVTRARLDEVVADEQLLRSGSRDEELRIAAADVDKAEAGVQRARSILELLRVRAPFDATVVRIDLESGEFVNMTSSPYAQPGIELADLSELWARVDVPENRIGSVRIGAPARVVVEAFGPQELEAEVVEISPVADRRSNTVSVAVRVLGQPGFLRPDMSARVTIAASKQSW